MDFFIMNKCEKYELYKRKYIKKNDRFIKMGL